MVFFMEFYFCYETLVKLPELQAMTSLSFTLHVFRNYLLLWRKKITGIVFGETRAVSGDQS